MSPERSVTKGNGCPISGFRNRTVYSDMYRSRVERTVGVDSN